VTLKIIFSVVRIVRKIWEYLHYLHLPYGGLGVGDLPFMLLGGLHVTYEGSTAITLFLVSSVTYTICEGPKLDA